MVSPSGMTLAGKHGAGVLSIGSTTKAGLQALPLQWSFGRRVRGQARRNGGPPRLARGDELAPGGNPGQSAGASERRVVPPTTTNTP